MNGPVKRIPQWILLAMPMSMPGWTFSSILEHVLPVLTLITFVLLFFVLPVALFFHFFSAKLLLRRYHARQVTDTPLYETVHQLATKLELPVPKVFITDSVMPNAFTVGRNAKHATIIVTTALIELLDKDEQKAVLAHELIHVKRKDTPTGTSVAAVAGILTALVPFAFWTSIFTGFGQEDDPAPNLIKFLVTSLVAPVAATIIQLAVAPSREYVADEQSVHLHDKPDKLVSALQKIESSLNSNSFAVNPAHVPLFIMDPLHNGAVTIMDIRLPTYWFLFRTHPATDDRVARLRQQNHSEGHKQSLKDLGLLKPLFFSSFSYLFVLFLIIVIDTFSNKDFVFLRAAAISVVYLGAVLVLFAIIFRVFRAKSRTMIFRDIPR
ncbi:Zn-dependent protease with chaperone function [Candidatus Methanophagaceae archaeon]|nr:Zn-dependent protease with chaperone function [Methanophagales archaeon]